MDAKYIVVSTTFDAREAAEAMAQELVERRLAACAQLTPVTSFYRWKGRHERAEEVLLAAKTSAERSQELVDFISRHHPYEVPEILVTPVIGGGEPYLRWLTEATAAAHRE